MRYAASEKLEIIRTVEGSHLPTKQTLDLLGIARTTFYRWYDRYANAASTAIGTGRNRPSAKRAKPLNPIGLFRRAVVRG